MAIPVLEYCKEQINSMTPKQIEEYRDYDKRKQVEHSVCSAVLILFGEKNKNYLTWAKFSSLVSEPRKFLNKCQYYNPTKITDSMYERLRPIVNSESFNEDEMRKVNETSAVLCGWVLALFKFSTIYRYVEPLRLAAEEAESISW